MKTHAVMFTWKRKWTFSKPLKVNNTNIELKTSTKFLGVIRDHKLSWNEHIFFENSAMGQVYGQIIFIHYNIILI